MSRPALPLALLLALSAAPAAAQAPTPPPATTTTTTTTPPTTPTKPAGDDDDILAPVDSKGKPKVTDPTTKAKKVGFVPLVAIGEAQKPLADDVAARLAKELNESSFGVLPLALPAAGPAAAGPTADDAAAAAVTEGDAQLQKAEALLDKKQIGKAVAAFQAAIAAYEKGAGALQDVAPLLRAYALLAEAHALTGQDEPANAALRAMTVVNPEHELDKTRFPPQAVRAHQQGRDALMAQPKGRIFVDESGSGAEVFLDGRSVGPAPVRIADVPPGRHLVRAVRPGQGSFGAVVDVQGGAEAAVSPGFLKKGATGPIDELMRNGFSPDAAKVVADAAKAAGVDAGLVGVVGRKGDSVLVGLILVDAGGKGVVRLPRLDFQADLLDLAIEMTEARDAIEPALADKKRYGAPAAAPVLDAIAVGEGAKVAEVTMRYEFTAAPKEKRSRVTGEAQPDEGPPPAIVGVTPDDDGGRAISAGSSGRRASLRDDESRFGPTEQPRDALTPEEELPMTEQGWFWPTVIGASAGGAVLLLAGGVVGAVMLGFDPRPTGGAEVSVVLPEGT